MINGYMLYQTANIDSAVSLFSGAAATWYIFANQLVGSTAFALTVATSAAPTASQRLIGDCYWDGTNVDPATVRSYFPGLPIADYDSGWFAVVHNTLYTKTHAFGTMPRMFKVFWNANSDGSGANSYEVVVVVDAGGAVKSLVTCNATTIRARTGNDATAGTLYAVGQSSAVGYYRILAWK